MVPLKAVQVDRHLGLLSFSAIQANSIRALVALNAVELPDDETLQQEPATTSAMPRQRFGRALSCQAALRRSGLGCELDVAWSSRAGLSGRPGPSRLAGRVVGPVEHVDACRSYWQHLSSAECKKSPSIVKYESTWTPGTTCQLSPARPRPGRPHRRNLPHQCLSHFSGYRILVSRCDERRTALDEQNSVSKLKWCLARRC